jgi:hypothetical protein
MARRALQLTGMHRSYINQIEIMDATNCGLKTAFAVVNTFKSVHVTRLGSNGNFVVQPVRGLCFDQIDASHATTASTVVDPVVEGVSGTGILLSGAQGMVITGGTSEGNNRGIEMSSGSDRNAIIDIDMEVNTVEDMLIGSSHNIFMGVLASSSAGGALGAHLSATANDNVLSGGLYTSIQLDAGAKSNTLDIGFNGAGVTDNGTDTKILRLWDNNNTRNAGIPWSSRDTVPAIAWSGLGTPDKQDMLAGSYTFTTTPTTLSNTVVTASKPWRILFIGTWGNNTEGGGLQQIAPILEATTAAPTLTIGTVTVTISVNGSNQFSAVTGANTAAFSGRIFPISNNQGVAGAAAMNLKGSITGGTLVASTASGAGTVSADHYINSGTTGGGTITLSTGSGTATTFSGARCRPVLLGPAPGPYLPPGTFSGLDSVGVPGRAVPAQNRSPTNQGAGWSLRMVVVRSACPASSWIVLAGAPRMARCEQKVCRSLMQVLARRQPCPLAGHLHPRLQRFDPDRPPVGLPEEALAPEVADRRKLRFRKAGSERDTASLAALW